MNNCDGWFESIVYICLLVVEGRGGGKAATSLSYILVSGWGVILNHSLIGTKPFGNMLFAATLLTSFLTNICDERSEPREGLH